MTVASQALTGPAQGPWDKHDGRYTLRVLGFIEKQVGQRPHANPYSLVLAALRQTLTASPCAACARSSSLHSAGKDKLCSSRNATSLAENNSTVAFL